MKLATWNVNSLNVRLPQVLDWLAANPVDALALQELKLTDDKFPAAAFAQAGYQAQWFGQKTYNGVALLSRQPARDVIKNIPGFDDDMARVITATLPLPDGAGNPASVRVIGAYFPNGQEPGSDKFDYKMAWLKGLRQWLHTELQQHPNLVLMGDYNITFDDADVWDPEGMRDQIHCTDDERYHLQALVALGLTDAFRLFAQPPKSYSWWDYRDMAFRRNRGMRIDHILISQSLKARASACQIDKTPRKNDRPSDHTPVVLTLSES
ncbi:MAG: exodeoxyribonuclease III [Rhodoferax sp.]|jgi:exodeoxyribonuclease-3|uniref:exodeoxyribonuclease III n=1 Tax=Rhodoferax sp. TaxID=50421 RepID=UPI001B6F64FC|nr:exodeoxyribonuclease III [Rhodoferax sp.]MBP9147296.1 exodeoxyribonuclease III [Rhodoferax sp.]MBP9735465.1 exodeoxyribonuclease III [Rhodoferax sp.]